MRFIFKTAVLAIILVILNAGIVYADVPVIYYQNEAYYPPYRFQQDGHFEGFEVELTNLIFRDEDYTVMYSSDKWDTVYEKVRTGKIDTCGMLAVLDNRKNEVLFTKPLFKTYLCVYSKGDIKGISLDNLKNYRIAVGKGQFSESILRDKIGISKYSAYENINDAIDAVEKGNADILFENQEVVNYMIIQKGLKGVILPRITNLFPIDIAYGVKKDNPKLVEYINERTDDLKASGVYDQLFQEYFFTHSDYYYEAQPKENLKIIIILGLGVFVGFLILFIYTKFLKKKIYKINKELFERHQQLKVTLASIGDGVVAADIYGNIEYINKTAMDLIGVTYEEAFGKPINEFLNIISENTRKRVLIPIKEAADNDRQVWIEESLLLVTQFGIELSIEASVSPIKDDSGKIIGTVLVFKDITERQMAGEIIRYERDFSRSLVDYSNMLILVLKPDAALLEFNRYAQSVTGFSQYDVLGDKWIGKLIDSKHMPIITQIIEGLRTEGIPPVLELPVLCKDHDKIHVLWNNSIVYDKNGAPDSIICLGTNITERKQAERKLAQSYQELEAIHEELTATEEELRTQYEELETSQKALSESEERYRVAMEGAADGLWDYDIQEDKAFFSNRCSEILGYKGKEIPDDFEVWTSLIHPDYKEKCINSINDHLKGKTLFYSQEYKMKMKSGEYKWVLSRGKAMWDKHGKPIRMAGSLTDISERKKNEEAINNMAYHDSLTGLPNRSMFYNVLSDTLNKAERNGNRACLLFLDLDDFKSVNDTLGHVYGDQVLKMIGQMLKHTIEENAIIARLSGDEFVVLFPRIDGIKEIEEYAKAILQLFQQPVSFEDHEIYITLSIGIAMYPDDGTDAETLIRNADIAMYCAKERGKNNYQLYNGEMDTKIVRKLMLESNLRYAIKNREFKVYYQPIIDIESGAITGMEALVRWIRSNGEIVPPMDFIPMAEETGLIVPIGEYVLRTACKQNRDWQNAGFAPIRMSVNMSPRQFQQPDLIDKIKEILADTGLEPNLLSLEITESVTMNDLDLTIKTIEKLRNMGIEVSLDDFGTGYSSLNYLRKLPIDTLKIDKAFVRDLTEKSGEVTIIKAIIMLAHSMNLKVVAEGVENHNQFSFLKGQNCDMVQGFLFSRPLPSSQVEDILKRGSMF